MVRDQVDVVFRNESGGGRGIGEGPWKCEDEESEEGVWECWKHFGDERNSVQRVEGESRCEVVKNVQVVRW